VGAMNWSRHSASWVVCWVTVAWCVGGCSDSSDAYLNNVRSGTGGGQEAGEAGGPFGSAGDGVSAGADGGQEVDESGGPSGGAASRTAPSGQAGGAARGDNGGAGGPAAGRTSAGGSDVTNERTGGTGTGIAGDTDVIEGESAGSGGVGGQAGGSAGGLGTGGVQDCGTHGYLVPNVSMSRGGEMYDMRAVVERSTSDSLLLAVVGGVAGAGGADSSGAPPPRIGISSWTDLPPFPAGAQLSVSRAGDTEYDVMYGYLPWALSVRDPAGVLLFGAFRNAASSPASPVSIGAVTPSCTTAYQDDCYQDDLTVTYNQVEVRGDTTVVVGDSETATLAVDGSPYDVYVNSREYAGATNTMCLDYHLATGVALDIRARDLASRASELPIGTLPDCAVGNDPEPPVGFRFTGIDETAAYDLAVSYVGHDAGPDSLDFDIPDVPGAKLSIDGAAKFLSEPPLGQRLWLSHQAMYANALLDAEGGAPLLAVVYADSPQSPPSDWLRSVLGVTVTAEQRCLYADNDPYGETWLWDFVFGTEPPVRVSTGSAASLDLGGQPYVAWFWGQSSIWLVLYRDQ
jgi:hypothetical protein